jgi:hypothetical protein
MPPDANRVLQAARPDADGSTSPERGLAPPGHARPPATEAQGRRRPRQSGQGTAFFAQYRFNRSPGEISSWQSSTQGAGDAAAGVVLWRALVRGRA